MLSSWEEGNLQGYQVYLWREGVPSQFVFPDCLNPPHILGFAVEGAVVSGQVHYPTP